MSILSVIEFLFVLEEGASKNVILEIFFDFIHLNYYIYCGNISFPSFPTFPTTACTLHRLI